MKNLILSLMLVALAISGCQNQQNSSVAASSDQPEVSQEKVDQMGEVMDGPSASFDFEETSHDFGTINEGDVVEHIFKFTNSGKSPLVIKNAVGSCGCTVPEWPKKPVAVGETGEILVKFNSTNKPNIQNKVVSITANTDPPVTRLTIKANVIPESQQTAGPVRK